jgi:hypothetical protein
VYKALLQTVSTCRQAVNLAAGDIAARGFRPEGAVVSAAFLCKDAGTARLRRFDDFISRAAQWAAKEVTLSLVDEFQVRGFPAFAAGLVLAGVHDDFQHSCKVGIVTP